MFALDEYENFLDYQQRVVNTYLKHAGQQYSFKIGVRELGWRCHATLNANEQLRSADGGKLVLVDEVENRKLELSLGAP